MWTIHQPKPRAASPQTFSFLNDPPERPQQSQLLTPSSTPEPKSSARQLSIPDLVSTDEHFGKVNTLQTAVDTFERAAIPGNSVLTFDQTGEGEYLLSARPWEVGECRRANQELWDRLGGHSHTLSPPPARGPVAQPAALSYLTPPSSPEPVCKRDLAPIAHVEPLNVPEPIVTPDADFPADPISNEGLGYLSDYDYEDEWTADSPCIPAEELPAACAPEPISPSDCWVENDMFVNSKRPISPTLPMVFSRFSAPDFSAAFRVQDLTSQLDVSKFSEWPIARGGFGEVWKGTMGSDDMLQKKGRPIAVKRLTMYSSAGDEGARKLKKRTARELSIWSNLKHPNILPLLGTCSFRGGVGLVSEWQENGNATEWVRTNPEVDRMKLCQGICDGLKYLHGSGIVHGDLRGGNVLICDDDTPKLIDFGLASMKDGSLFSASSTLAGTLRWMAPELQATEGQGATTAGDMFAFGMTMLELFTGLPPFSAVKNDIAVLLKYQKGERPPRPSGTEGNLKGSNRDVITARTNVPRERGEPRDVCVLMDDQTWRQVQRCWAQEPSARPSANKMLKWFMWKKKRRHCDLEL